VFIGYAAFTEVVAWNVCVPFYLGGLLWTVVYDTIYAFQDREFDKKLGLQSTAIQIENKPKESLAALALASTSLWALGGINAGIGNPVFFAGIGAIASSYAW
jgi:4-hydroxybenzoate polyprenyltransferase